MRLRATEVVGDFTQLIQGIFSRTDRPLERATSASMVPLSRSFAIAVAGFGSCLAGGKADASLAKDRGEIFVITGPINRTDDEDEITIKADANPCRNEIKLEGPKGRTEICGKDKKCAEGKGVAIPIALYKIIYDPKNKRTNAYILPNIDHRKLDKTRNSLEYLKKYRVAVRTVEQYTGLQFLRAIPARERKAQVDECVATMFGRNL